MPFVKRVAGEIVSVFKWPQQEHPEELPDDDAELIAFYGKSDPLPPPRNAIANTAPNENSVPAIRNKLNELLDELRAQGVI